MTVLRQNYPPGTPLIQPDLLSRTAALHAHSEAIHPLVLSVQTDGSWLLALDPTAGSLFSHPFRVSSDSDGTYTMAAGRVLDGIQSTDVPLTDLGALSEGDYVWLEITYTNDGTRAVVVNSGAALAVPDYTPDTASTVGGVAHDTAGTVMYIIPIAQIDATGHPEEPIRQYQFCDIILRYGLTYTIPVVVRTYLHDNGTALELHQVCVDHTYRGGVLVEIGEPYDTTLTTTAPCPTES